MSPHVAMKAAFLLLLKIGISFAEEEEYALAHELEAEERKFQKELVKSLPKVPKVSFAGGDGFPAVPEVSSMMDSFSQMVDGASSEAGTLQVSLKKVQEESHHKLQRLKASDDKKLHDQEAENQKVQAANAELAKTIMSLHKENDQTLLKIKKEEKVTKFRSSELKLLQKQLMRAEKAVTRTLEEDDKDNQADEELDVKGEKMREGVASPQKAVMLGQISTKTAANSSKEASASTEEASSSNESKEDIFGSTEEASTSAEEASATSKEPASSEATSPEAAPMSFMEVSMSSEAQRTDNVLRQLQTQLNEGLSEKAFDAPAPPKPQTKVQKTAQKKVAKAVHLATGKVRAASRAGLAPKVMAKRKKPAKKGASLLEARASLDTNSMLDEPIGQDADDASPAVEEAQESTVAAANQEPPENVIDVMMKGLKKLRSEESKSEEQLQEFYDKAFKAGEGRHEALLEQAKALGKSYKEMEDGKEKLEAKLEHLMQKDHHLESRVKSMASFLAKLEKVADSPLDKVKPALEDARSWTDPEEHA
eukprot:TRINITY_DN12073_c0_g1_i1.p1 TRINITY_DN12073_c0_g1~~TRINITY_DN12073_c0_g1_i1.p1  ORF type:complete len:537 (+),score=199.63 TRINITY_DN12073_c0_g1_i1:29-1639(+)